MKSLRTYSLEWLDSLISVTLNPERPYRDKLQPGDISDLVEKIPVECIQVQSELNNQIFGVNKEGQVQHMVKKYHNAIVALRETLHAYEGKAEPRKQPILELQELLIASLNGLLSFIEKRYGYYIDPPRHGQPSPKNPSVSPVKAPARILCNLSGDQIAVILRGADESQVFKARSMNAVFKAIVPYLSTEHKENLSVDAMVAALQAIIKKIQGY